MANTNSLALVAASSQYATITNAAQTNLGLSGNFTIECRVNFSSLPTADNQEYLFVAKYDTGGQRAYQIGLIKDAVVPAGLSLEAVISGNGAAKENSILPWVPIIGTWNHVAITCTIANPLATEFEFFVGGVSKGNGTGLVDSSVGSIFSSTAPFFIGARGTTASPMLFMDGMIDDVRVWNVVRTPEQISYNMFKELTGNETGLVGYWKLNNDYTDSSSSGNNLTAGGSPSFSTNVPFINQVWSEQYE